MQVLLLNLGPPHFVGVLVHVLIDVFGVRGRREDRSPTHGLLYVPLLYVPLGLRTFFRHLLLVALYRHSIAWFCGVAFSWAGEDG